MSTDKKPAAKTYRYKFSSDFLANLKEFSRIHRFDESQIFKEHWEVWCKENKSIIEQESNKLKADGYQGDVLVKMYKSARYYFKNKSNEKKQAKKRRQYIGLEPDFRDAIDEHIENISMRQELKPQDGFVNFLDSVKYAEVIRLEKLRLESYDFTKDQISAKFKKTYKNRYFTNQKKDD